MFYYPTRYDDETFVVVLRCSCADLIVEFCDSLEDAYERCKLLNSECDV